MLRDLYHCTNYMIDIGHCRIRMKSQRLHVENKMLSRSKMKDYSKLITTRHHEYIRKMDSRSTKKLIALRLLRSKNSMPDKKSNMLFPQRKLRPRFPYSASDEWPLARAHRVASLNARAKVHILYENECRGNGNESEEGGSTETGKLGEDDRKISNLIQSNKQMSKTLSCREKQEKQISKPSEKNGEKLLKKIPVIKKKRRPRGQKRKLEDVEIIDTRSCKRMANLNAQAILAASYLLERSRKERGERKCTRAEKKSEDSNSIVNNCDDIHSDNSIVSISHSEDSSENIVVDDLEDIIEATNTCNNVQNCSSEDRNITVISLVDDDDDEHDEFISKETQPNENKDKNTAAECTAQEMHSIASTADTTRTMTSTAVNKVGMTEYTEVTKVHINATEDMDIKEEGKLEQKIEHILEKDDVAITRMYHYQTKGNSQSYCLQMQATYKPSGAKEFSPPPSVGGQTSPRKVRLATPPHVMSAMLHNSQNYYNYPSQTPVIPEPNPQAYPVGHSLPGMNNVPIVSMGPIARHYSSAFTVPHHGHPPPMTYPPNEYGYYQPAGPLIQPMHDPCLIHKPVPYHPQHHHLHTPQNPHSSYPDQCLSHHSLPPPPPPPPGPPPPPPHQSSRCSIDAVPTHQHQSLPPPHHYPQEGMGNNPPYQLAHHPVNQAPNHPPPSAHHQQYPNHSLPPVNYHCPTHTQNPPPLPQSHLYLQHGHQYCQEYPVATYAVASPVKVPQKDRSMPPPPPSMPSISVPTAVPKSEPMTPPQEGKHSNICVDAPHVKSSKNAQKNLEVRFEKKSEEPVIEKTIPSSSLTTSNKLPPTSLNNDNKTNIILLDGKPEKSLQSFSTISSEKDKKEKANNSSENLRNEKQEEHRVISSVERRARLLKLRHHLKQSRPAYPINVNLDHDQHQKQTIYTAPLPDDTIYKSPPQQQQSPISQQDNNLNSDTMEKPLETESSVESTQNLLHKSREETVSPSAPQKKLLVSLSRITLPKRMDRKRFSNGWTWAGEPFEKMVYYSNEDPPCLRRCYLAMQHVEGDIIKARDCVLLKSGPRKTDVPFVAKVVALWERPHDGEMMMSLLWYYRPEHAEIGKKQHAEGEIFASRHKDANSVACIEEKCYVLTFSEYCRYRGRMKMLSEGLRPKPSVVPDLEEGYARKDRLPSGHLSPELVFFCRKVYDFRQKRILKNRA